MSNPFNDFQGKPATTPGVFSEYETRLANRNSGALLETLTRDITPTGTHYLLTHFDVPMIDETEHVLRFGGAFDAPFALSMDEIRALPAVTRPVTLECAGNGRAGVSPRSFSMPWAYEAVGTSVWTGTPLAPLIARACPAADAIEVSFTGVDFGYDGGEGHRFGRALTLDQIAEMDVMLVYGMNGGPLLPQHGYPLRLLVPGWYGMASVKWLSDIEALTEPYQGYQQVRTYRFRQDADDPGVPITALRVKSLMVPPGVPDWISRKRLVAAGPCTVQGRAWAGRVPIVRVEFAVDGVWQDAELAPPVGEYAWTAWQCTWQAAPGWRVLQCRATDANGNVQPLDAPWDFSGFGNNAAHRVEVFVDG